jgi:hypothetical protein
MCDIETMMKWMGVLLMLALAGCTVGFTPTPTLTPTVTVTSSPIIPTLTASPLPEATPTREVVCSPNAFVFGYSDVYANPGLTERLAVDGYPVIVRYLDSVTILESAIDDRQQTWAYRVRTADGVEGWLPFYVLPVVCER